MKLIEIIKELKIEVSKPNIFQAVVAKQYDMNTRFIKATFVDGADIIVIPTGATIKAVINAERPDGQAKGFEGEVNEDGTVTVPLHSWMLEKEGTVICDISVIDTEAADNKKLTTTAFTLLVEKAAFGGDDITTDPQYDVLVTLLEASETAQEALDKSNEANAKYVACVEATEAATAAAEELTEIKQELAEGGYITGVKERNRGIVLGFWVGTKEEYNALPEPPQNCYVIITDDTTVQEIRDQLGKAKPITIDELDTTICPGFYYLHETMSIDGYSANYWYLTVSAYGSGQPQCTQILEPIWAGDSYRLKRIIRKTDTTASPGPQPWEWENPPMENDVEYRTTERIGNKPVYTIRSTNEWYPTGSIGWAAGGSTIKIQRVSCKVNEMQLPILHPADNDGIDLNMSAWTNVYFDNASKQVIIEMWGDRISKGKTITYQLWYTK